MRVCKSKSLRALLSLAFSVSFACAQNSAPTIRRISLLAGSTLELEISASAPVHPKAHLIHAPERLILDFAGALPAKTLRNLEINRGEIKAARVGLFSSNPPITRVVLDMTTAQPYQLYPAGNSVVIKFGADKTLGRSPIQPALSREVEGTDDAPVTVVSIERGPVAASAPNKSAPQFQPAQVHHPAHPAQMQRVNAVNTPPAPSVQQRMAVAFENGLLSIRANKANLSEVLAEVHRRTGAEIEIPPAAASEQVFTSLGPGAPKEVLASLLNGSRFNFIVIGSEHDPGGIRQIVLTPKQGGAPEAVVYPPCGVAQPGQPAIAQVSPEETQPAQAYEPPMPPQLDSGDPQSAPPTVPPPPPEP